MALRTVVLEVCDRCGRSAKKKKLVEGTFDSQKIEAVFCKQCIDRGNRFFERIFERKADA